MCFLILSKLNTLCNFAGVSCVSSYVLRRLHALRNSMVGTRVLSYISPRLYSQSLLSSMIGSGSPCRFYNDSTRLHCAACGLVRFHEFYKSTSLRNSTAVHVCFHICYEDSEELYDWSRAFAHIFELLWSTMVGCVCRRFTMSLRSSAVGSCALSLSVRSLHVALWMLLCL